MPSSCLSSLVHTSWPWCAALPHPTVGLGPWGGSWGCHVEAYPASAPLPAPMQAVVLLEIKQQQQREKNNIYISPQTSLKDPNGWNRSLEGNKSKSPPRVRAGCTSQPVPSSWGAHPNIPAPPALAHLRHPPAQGPPMRHSRGCPTSQQQPPEGSADGEASVCVPCRLAAFQEGVGSLCPHQVGEVPCLALSRQYDPTQGSQRGSERAP